MTVSTGERAMFPYWLHRCVSDIRMNRRCIYSSNHQQQTTVSETSNPTTIQPSNCEICLSFEKTIVFMPCKHIYRCEKCSVGLTNCPMCRTEII